MAKKKFLDGKLGTFLKEKIPNVVEVVGDVLPDEGVFGIVKNIIDQSTMSETEKAEARALAMEEEQMYMADRANARNREIEMAKTGKSDWMMKLVGVVVLFLFVFCTVVVMFFDIKNEKLVIHLVGEIIGFAAGMIFYYFGTSKSSADKTKLLKT